MIVISTVAQRNGEIYPGRFCFVALSVSLTALHSIRNNGNSKKFYA